MTQNRQNRELQTREKTTRKKSWSRPTVLPDPTPQDGYKFHWVRVSTILECPCLTTGNQRLLSAKEIKLRSYIQWLIQQSVLPTAFKQLTV
jgi:hypothetical protein